MQPTGQVKKTKQPYAMKFKRFETYLKKKKYIYIYIYIPIKEQEGLLKNLNNYNSET